MNNEKISSLQGLRAIAFLGVYYSHTSYPLFAGSGACAVAIFFALSGFLTVYNKLSSEERSYDAIVFSDVFRNACKKIKYLWVLHVILTLITIPLLFMGEGIFSTTQVGVALITNILLIQTWFPFALRSINGVSWYLCVLFFIYIASPYIVSLFKKRIDKKRAVLLFVICVITQLCISFLAGSIPYDFIHNSWIEKDLTHWIVYEFPVTRVIDYVGGMCFGYMFVSREISERNTNTIRKSIVELLIILYMVLANVVYIVIINKTGDVSLRPNRWFIYVDLFSLASCTLVYIIALNEGYVSKLLSTRPFGYLGTVSGSAFLIHRVILRYALGLGNAVHLSSKLIYLIEFTVCFIITLVASQIWIIIERKIKIKNMARNNNGIYR